MDANIKSNLFLGIEASTRNIPKHTADALEKREGDLWNAISYTDWHEYGWILWVGVDHADAAREVGHPELASLIDVAIEIGCRFLLLDCDADQVPGMPTFDWYESTTKGELK